MYMEYTQRGMQAQPFGTQVVRVFVEDRGCIGFVDVDEHAGTTLEHVRKKIGEDLDGVSEDFHFLLEMGGGESVPVQHKQEKNAFFGELEGEYDEENLLDDDDWAGLGDFGDATFGGDNPMYGGAAEVDSRADNEM